MGNRKTQENSLEKEVGVVKTLKEFAISEVAPYVPFSFMNKKIIGNWIGKGKGFKKGFGRRMIPNVLISSLASAAILLYSIASLGNGTPNYTRWPEIQKQRVIQEEQEAREYSNKRFYEADKNGDFVLDPNEFYDGSFGRRER